MEHKLTWYCLTGVFFGFILFFFPPFTPAPVLVDLGHLGVIVFPLIGIILWPFMLFMAPILFVALRSELGDFPLILFCYAFVSVLVSTVIIKSYSFCETNFLRRSSINDDL